MPECDFVDRCCYPERLQAALPRLSRLQASYCRGPLFRSCERRRFYLECGECAPAHLLPSGEMLDHAEYP